MNILRTACLTAALVSASIVPSYAQNACGNRAYVLSELQKRFNEFPVFEGKVRDVLFVLTRSDEGGWTLLRISGELACLVAGGKSSSFDKGV